MPEPRRPRLIAALRQIAHVAVVAAVAASCPAPLTAFEPRVEYDWGGFRCRAEYLIDEPERLRDELHELRRSLHETLRLPDEQPVISIQVYAGRRGYVADVLSIAPDARRQRGLYVKGDSGTCVCTFAQRDLSDILRHETTHALLHEALPYVPLWLDEGLASYFEVAPASRETGHPFRKRIQWSLQVGWRPDVQQLEAVRRSEDLSIGDYRHAWAWVHFLLHESEESRTVLTDYLADIAAGDPPRPLSECLRQNLPDATGRFVRHFETLRE